MNFKNLALLVITNILLTACAMQPTMQQQMDADYGPSPTDEDKAIKDYMSTVLKDPMSAQINLTVSARKSWTRDGFGSSFIYGWGACAQVNAKNSFGGYVGFQNYFFLLRGDSVVYTPGPGYISDKSCANLKSTF